jgi:hypothetical protein
MQSCRHNIRPLHSLVRKVTEPLARQVLPREHHQHLLSALHHCELAMAVVAVVVAAGAAG